MEDGELLIHREPALLQVTCLGITYHFESKYLFEQKRLAGSLRHFELGSSCIGRYTRIATVRGGFHMEMLFPLTVSLLGMEQKISLSSQYLYYFPIGLVTNYHKLIGLTQICYLIILKLGSTKTDFMRLKLKFWWSYVPSEDLR